MKIKTPIRLLKERKLRNFAKTVQNANILEVGCGTNSYAKYFPNSHFLATDIVETSQTDEVADVMNLQYPDKSFDVVLCLSILEHLPNPQNAIGEIYRVLRENGVAVFYVPFFYPLHDLPNDYWRFTESGCYELLKLFHEIEIEQIGFWRIPFGYIIMAKK